MMITILNTIEFFPEFCKEFIQSFLDSKKLFFFEISFGDPRLIGNKNDFVSTGTEMFENFFCTVRFRLR